MKIVLSCEEAGRLIAESQDRRLGFMEWLGLRFHLTICEICSVYERQLAVVRSLTSRWGKTAADSDSTVVHSLPPDTRARISEAIKRAR